MSRMPLAVGLGLLLIGGALHLFAGGGAAATVVVEANQSNQFAPSTVTITEGDTVRWTVVGSVPHDVTADGGAFPSSAVPMAGGMHEVTFDEPGTFTYTCTIHAPDMDGTVIVEAAQATATSTSIAPTATRTRTPGPSSTPSRTPTGTVTVAASATPVATFTGVPATPLLGAPTNATEPAGGAGAGISAPQTGGGGAAGSSSLDTLAIVFGAAGVALACMSIAMRRRV